MNRKIFLVALAAMLCCTGARAQKSAIVTDSLYSRILSATVRYNVYLPQNYEQAGHHPAIYLLHGLGGDYTDWDRKGNVKMAADRMIRSGEMMPAVIIMPNAGNVDRINEWNGYFNMPGWNYEDFFFKELLPAVESKYKCGGSKDQRAVMGLSMGGGGSTVYAQRHSELFSSCYAMSAWMTNEPSQVKLGETPSKLDIVCKSVSDHSSIRFLTEADNKVIEKLKTVKWFVDCGDDDFILNINLDFYKVMRDKGIPCELRIRDGVHNWEYWHEALSMSLPFASRNFNE
ncbi:MAG: esterase family protein [Bacteroidales bacterium]|nr:esterase family protein [Bacteroidales bacterium]